MVKARHAASTTKMNMQRIGHLTSALFPRKIIKNLEHTFHAMILRREDFLSPFGENTLTLFNLRVSYRFAVQGFFGGQQKDFTWNSV
jgi:hypothetical protein